MNYLSILFLEHLKLCCLTRLTLSGIRALYTSGSWPCPKHLVTSIGISYPTHCFHAIGRSGYILVYIAGLVCGFFRSSKDLNFLFFLNKCRIKYLKLSLRPHIGISTPSSRTDRRHQLFHFIILSPHPPHPSLVPLSLLLQICNIMNAGQDDFFQFQVSAWCEQIRATLTSCWSVHGWERPCSVSVHQLSHAHLFNADTAPHILDTLIPTSCHLFRSIFYLSMKLYYFHIGGQDSVVARMPKSTVFHRHNQTFWNPLA